MDNPFLGTIIIWPINFAPRGWAYCQGQLLSISQNTALFSLLGTTYGGDGRTTFGLPDMQGRVPVGAGHGAGLTARTLGQKGGNEQTNLTVANLPAHTHSASTGAMSVTIKASVQDGDEAVPSANSTLAKGIVGRDSALNYKAGGAPTVDLNTGAAVSGSVTIGNTGGNQWFSNEQPFLVTNYIIAMVGMFPSRS